jgi:hypothetical protein
MSMAGMGLIPIANGLPDPAMATRPTSSATSGSRVCGPHLPSTGQAAKYRTALDVNCDNPTVALLSLEIGRIEQEWVDEAKSYPRRVRK